MTGATTGSTVTEVRRAARPSGPRVPVEVVERVTDHLVNGQGDAVLSAARGLGLTSAFRAVVEGLERHGIRVRVVEAHRVAWAGLGDWPDVGPGDVLVLDVRHHADEAIIPTALDVAGAAGAQLLLVTHSGPEREALTDTVRQRGGTMFVLRPWGVAQVRELLRTKGFEERDAAEVTALTGGLPWLLSHVSARAEDDPLGGGPQAPSPESCGSLVLGLLDACSPSVVETALALAVGYPPAGRPALPGVPPDDPDEEDRLLRSVEAAGLLGQDGTVPPLARDCLLRHAPAHRVQRWREQLVEDVLAAGEDLSLWAVDLVRQGVHDQRVVAALLERVRSLTVEEACSADEPAALLRSVLAAGSPDPAVRVELCRLALLQGDPTAAARELDHVLLSAGEEVPGSLVPLAVEVADAVDLPHRSTDVLRWVEDRDPGAADHPAVAMSRYAAGDRSGGDAVLARAVGRADPASSASLLLAQGVRASLHEDPAASLPQLMLAVQAAATSAGQAALADSPAASVALWGLHAGDLHLVDSVIGTALDQGDHGPLARTRLRILAAWGAMQGGRLEEAAEALHGLGEPAPRDRLWVSALRVGLARRADDPARLRTEWAGTRETVLRHPVTLWQLLPLAELCLAAARMHDFELVRPQWEQAGRLLANLHEPVLWSTPFHWYAVQVALQQDAPSVMAPHASALVRAAGTWPHAATLSAAGRAWVRVRAREVDPVEVERAARALASAGLPWEAARLASHGAATTTERRVSARLLECARELLPRPTSGAPSGGPPLTGQDEGRGARPGGVLTLTERERQVAELVLAGRTYKQVGEALYLSPKTVEHHVARIRRRAGASSRSELIEMLHAVVGTPSSGTGR